MSGLGRMLRISGRLLGALLALTLLGVLLVGVPWGLWHYIGWPLPTHMPTVDELEAFLLTPLSATTLLDLLACFAWPLWLIFVIDVARCVPSALRGVRMPPVGPVHALAAFLVAAGVLGLISPRAPAGSSLPITPVAATAPITPAPALPPPPVAHALTEQPPAPPRDEPGIVIVRAPTHGIYDSLWRIAERQLGDGTRWPEIWELNKGQIQVDGRKFTNPNLIHPGWRLRCPDPPPAVESSPPSSGPHSAPAAPDPAPPTSPPNTSPTPGSQPSIPATPGSDPAPTAPAPTPPGAPQSDPHPGTGISVATGAFVGLGLAALITVALLTVRLRQRRSYRLGSGKRDDITIAPVVRALRLAHDEATLPRDSTGDVIQPDPPHISPAIRQATARDRARATADRLAPGGNNTVVGLQHGQDQALNLARTRGLGLVGPGATAAVRALVVSLLADAHRTTPGTAEVLIPAADLRTLLGDEPPPHPLPARLRVVDSLDAALDLAEADILSRARHAREPADSEPPAGPLVLVATPPPHTEGRLQAILDNGSTLGLAGVLLGHWRPGGTVRVRLDGTVSAVSPDLAASLADTRLFTLPATDASALLELLGAADIPNDPQAQDNENDPESPTEDPEPVRPVTAAPPQIQLNIPPTRTAPPGEHTPPPPSDDEIADWTPQDQNPRPRGADPPLQLSVLGRMHLVHHGLDGAPDVIEALAPKQREILVYLALHPGGARRETLTATIWPNAPGDRPYNSFHATLSQMRSALRAATGNDLTHLVVVKDGHYSLNQDLVTVDLWQLHKALRESRHTPGEPQRLAALRHVPDLYHGELAESLTAEWLEAPREALRRDVLDALNALIHALGPHDPDQVLTLLEQARTIDRYNESLYQDIIRTQARLGRHDAIPRTLTLLTAILAEIDQHPSRDTLALGEFLQRSQTTSRAPHTAAS
ncbi:MAG TPA: BTAD domain-containing putative transcriptional regulator [Pseudonocardiaceae bacterium]|nr:BTAD domain-containing putative transcriptional regulator [Pseudonocardiaceae bacterium]